MRELETTIKRSLDELEDGQALSKECLKNAIIFQEDYQEKTSQKPSEHGDDFISLVKSLEQRLEKLESQRGARLSDNKKALNDLFLLIQQNNPIRKSQVIERHSYLEKSFHHWVKILRDEYQVIESERVHNHLLYKPAPDSVLKVKEMEGKLIVNDNYYLLA